MENDHTYIIDDVGFGIVSRPGRIRWTYNIDLIIFVRHISAIYIDYVIGIVDTKSKFKTRRKKKKN